MLSRELLSYNYEYASGSYGDANGSSPHAK